MRACSIRLAPDKSWRVRAQFKRNQVAVEQSTDQQAILEREHLIDLQPKIVHVFEATPSDHCQTAILIEAPHVLGLFHFSSVLDASRHIASPFVSRRLLFNPTEGTVDHL